MGETIRYLGCDRLGPKDITLVKSMLRLFEGTTQARWQFAEQQPCDALLVPEERHASADSDAALDALFIRTLPPQGADPDQAAERRQGNSFVVRPIRALTLLQKLNEIGSLLDAHETRQTLASHGWDDLREWRDLLAEWRHSSDSYLVETTLCKFVVFPLSRRFLSEKPGIPPQELMQARVRGYQILPPERAAQILRSKKTNSLTWLGWHAAHYASSSELLPEFADNKPFKLQRWPDFGSLDHDPAYVPLAGMLSQRVVTLSDLQQMGGFPAESLHRFLNATALTGYLEFVGNKPGSWLFGRRSEYAAQRLGLFGRIRGRLGI